MSFSVSVLATGSELLDGRVLDTNTNFVASELAARGLKLKRVLCVDDDFEELVSGLKELARVSDVIITSGGLGPTSDDLTRDIVAAFIGVGLAEHPDARAHLETVYTRRKRVLDAANLKQALLPSGAAMIPNQYGTAPGFLTFSVSGTAVASLSGVPREFKSMFTDTVLPFILERAGTLPRIERRRWKTFGLPESTVGVIVSALKLDDSIQVGYRAAFPEVHVTISNSDDPEGLESAAECVRRVLGPFIFSEEDQGSLEGVVHELLLQKNATIAVAESCTGGMLGSALTTVAGSSRYFKGGILAYSNEVKESELGVPAGVLQKAGAVSAETVEAMAHGVRKRFSTDLGVSISGVAGPDGGTPEKPVGTVYFGLASATGSLARRCFLSNERENVRRYATAVGLDMVRRHLAGLPIPEVYPHQDSVRV